MAERIQELFVELGLENDAKSFREAEGLFNSLRSSALQMGAALGGGLSLQQLTFGFAQSKDEMARFADQMGVSIQLVDEMGYAAQRSGGRAQDAFGIIQQMNDLMDGVTEGDIPGLNDAAFWGLHPTAITEAQDVADLIERIADQTAAMDNRARRNALQSLGLGSIAEHSLFTAGGDAIRGYREEARELSQITGEMVTVSQEFLDEIAKLTRLMGRFTNEISTEILPGLTKASEQFRDFLQSNDDDIIRFIVDGPEEFGRQKADQFLEWLREQHREGVDARGIWDKLREDPLGYLMARPEGIPAPGDIIQRSDRGEPDSPQARLRQPSAVDMTWSELSRSGIDQGADTWIPDVWPEALDSIQQMLRGGVPGGIGGDFDGLSPDELNYQPSPGELIPQGNRSELREGSRRQMEHHFPEQYQGNVTFHINGVTDPEAVADAVDRRLNQHATMTARRFAWPEGSV